MKKKGLLKRSLALLISLSMVMPTNSVTFAAEFIDGTYETGSDMGEPEGDSGENMENPDLPPEFSAEEDPSLDGETNTNVPELTPEETTGEIQPEITDENLEAGQGENFVTAEESQSMVALFSSGEPEAQNDATGEATEVSTYDGLVAALSAGEAVKLTDDITATGAINATDAKIDLGDCTLTLADNANNYFLGESTISNGTISINGVEVGGDCIIGVGNRSTDAILTLANVNLTGSNYSSAFAVLMVYSNSTLNISGGEWNLSDELYEAGGVIKNQDGAGSAGKVNITGTKMTLANVSRGICGATVVLDDVDMTITGGDNGINGSALTVKNSILNISGGTGRALTVTDSNVVVENSTLAFSNNGEADILFKTANALTVDANSTLNECKVAANVAGATINGTIITGTTDEKSTVTVTKGAATIKNPFLSGEGTQALPYLINNVDDLKLFRDQVNAGNSYSGKYVSLTANIDLNDEEWTPIGTSAYSFQGTFDGAGHVISNLKIDGSMDYDNGTGLNYAGFFGNANGAAAIKNVTFNNADVSGCLYVGVVVGRMYTGGSIENCHVTGKIYVDGYWYVGGIAGRPEYNKVVNNCSVIGGEGSGSYIKADVTQNADKDGSYVGGIAGFRAEGAQQLTNCTVQNLTISGATRVGGISGIAHYGNTIAGCSVKNVTLQAADGTQTVGLIAGACQGKTDSPSTFTNNTLENVTAKAGETAVTDLYGTNIDNGTPITNYVAIANGVHYESLEAAAAAASSNNGTVTLMRDITVAGWRTLKADNITIDGAGHTLTIVDTDYSKDDTHFTFAGTGLTVKNLTLDLSDAENGNIGGFSLGTGCELNKVTVKEGKYNVYLADGSDAKLDGCTFIKSDASIPAILTGTNGTTATIQNCTFDAARAGTLYGKVTFANNTVNEYNGAAKGISFAGAATVTGNVFNARVNLHNTGATVTGNQILGALEGDVVEKAQETPIDLSKNYWGSLSETDILAKTAGATLTSYYTKAAEDGTLSDEVIIYVAEVNGVSYTSLQEAIKAGGEVKLLMNIRLNETVKVPEGTTVTLDLNGKNINVGKTPGNAERSLYAIDNYGTLTLKDSTEKGSITARGVENFGTMTVESGKIVSCDSNGGAAIWNEGTLTVNDGTFETVTGSAGALNNADVSASAEINGGTFTTNNTGVIFTIVSNGTLTINDAVVTGNHGALAVNGGETVVNGGSFTANGIKGWTTNTVYASAGKLTIKDGSFIGVKSESGADSGATVLVHYAGADVVISGGEYAGGISSTGSNNIAVVAGSLSVTGGSYTDSTVAKFLADGYMLNSRYKVVEDYVVVNKSTKMIYTTLQSAFDEAKNGHVLEIQKDITINGDTDGNAVYYTGNQSFTVDFNDCTVTVNESTITDSAFYIKNTGTDGNAITFENGKIVAGTTVNMKNDADGSQVKSAVQVSGNTTVNLNNMTLESCRGNYFTVRANTNAVVNMKNCSVNSTYAGGVLAAGGTVELTNVTVDQQGMYKAPYNSTALAVHSNGKMTVNSGSYSTKATSSENTGASHGPWCVMIMNSGGELVIKNGTFSNDNYGDGVPSNPRGLISYAATEGKTAKVTITGGTFNAMAQLADQQDTSKKSDLDISGGSFNVPVDYEYCADGFIPTEADENNRYSVKEGKYVAVVNDVMYEDLAKAFEAAGLEGTVTLMNDVDLKDVDWTPIGTKEAPFKGTFDGGDYKISNLKVESSDDYSGLFGYLGGAAEVKNLTIENPTVVGGNYVGAVAGSAFSSVKITNVAVTGNIEIQGNYKVGGVIGGGYVTIENATVNGNGTITGVYAEADAEGDNVGGIIGFLGEGKGYKVTNATVKGVTITGTRKVGGVVGSAFQNNAITNAVVSDVTIGTTADADYAEANTKTMGVGGLVGLYNADGNNDGTLSGSATNVKLTNENKVTGVSMGYIAGGLRGTEGVAAPAVTISADVEAVGGEGATTSSFLPIEVNVGENQTYTTLRAASAYIESQLTREAVTINIHGNVTLSTGISFMTTKNVVVNGVNGTDPVITLVDREDHNPATYANAYRPSNQPTGFSFPDAEYYSFMEGSTIAFNNLTIDNQKNMMYEGGHTWRATYYMYAGAETANYTKVNFVGGVALAGNGSFVRCTFTEDDSQTYCLFADYEYSDSGEAYTLKIEGSTFNPADSAYGAVKVANDEGAVDLTVADNTFNKVPNKPAINTDTNVTATVTGNTFTECGEGTYKGDSGTVNGVDVTDTNAVGLTIKEKNTVQASGIISIESPLPVTVTDAEGNAKTDNKFEMNETAIVTAVEKQGYVFKGWYATEFGKENQLSTELRYEHTVTGDITLCAKYDYIGTQLLMVTGASGTYAVNETTQYQNNFKNYYQTYEDVTVKAIDTTKTFLYWMNEDGVMVSQKAEFTITMTSATYLTPVYDNGTAASVAIVEFVSKYNQVMKSVTYPSKDTFIYPDGPSYKDLEFTGWDKTEAEIQELIKDGETYIRVNPEYNDSVKTYTVDIKHIYGETVKATDQKTVESFGAAYLTANTYDDCKFAYWSADEAGDIVLSYCDEYRLTVTKNMTVYAQYKDEAVEKLPHIAITDAYSSKETNADGSTKLKVHFVAVRSVPVDGYRVVNHGVVYSVDTKFANTDEYKNLVLKGDGVHSADSRDEFNTNAGSYTLSVTVSTADKIIYARGYMTVEDADGNRMTYYSEVCSGSYDTLSIE